MVKDVERIEGFRGDYDFLSNFYPAPIRIGQDTFPTVEHAFQAHKTTDRGEFEKVMRAKTPKAAGKKVRLRPDWNRVKVNLMKDLVHSKFEQNPGLAQKLKDTGSAYLEERNSWRDTFWGVCNGKGENHLGKILMQVREELKGGTISAPADASCRSYGMHESYETGEFIRHPKFGLGRVEAIVGTTRMEVGFEGGRKLLICNRPKLGN